MIWVIAFPAIVGLQRIALGALGRHPLVVGSAAGITCWYITAFVFKPTGPDLVGYVSRYNALSHYSYGDILHDRAPGMEKDQTFWIVSKWLGSLGADGVAWLAILSGFFILTAVWVISKLSASPAVSFCLILGLGYVYFSAIALRQGLSIALCLLALSALLGGRRTLSIALIAIATLFHGSAIIFLLAHVVVRLRMSTLLFSVGVATIGGLLNQSLLRDVMNSFGWSETVAAYATRSVSLSWTLILLHGGILLAVWLLYVRFSPSRIDQALFRIALLGLPFFAFATVVAEFFRLGLYFSIVEVILLPNAVASVRNDRLRALLVGVIVMGATFYLLSARSYRGA